MKSLIKPLLVGCSLAVLASCGSHRQAGKNEFTNCAEALLDTTFKYYQVREIGLFNESYPKKEGELVTYLAGDDTVRRDKLAYLWPTSGMFSAVNALLRATGDRRYAELLDECIVPGLKCYYDTTRMPACYQSYVSEAGHSDRFYDDNIWLGLDYLESYELTGEKTYLDEAEGIWRFLMSGRDDKLGDGIYWCEQKKASKNACSNAPAAVLALKLYGVTKDEAYLQAGQELYAWTKKTLQDPADGLYFDNKSLDGKVTTWKFQYNSGQMMQAAALLYRATGEEAYLEDARALAKACDGFFFHDFAVGDGQSIRVLKNGNVWFCAIMLRGFEELYAIDGDPQYLKNFAATLRYAWQHNANANRLFEDEYFVGPRDRSKDTKWLLTQAAMVEMYARLSTLTIN